MDVSYAMDKTVTQLRSQLSEAQAIVSSSFLGFGLFGDAAGKTAAINALKLDADRITRLDTELRRQVLSGALTQAKWLSVAQITSDDIAAQTGYQQQSQGFNVFFDQTVVQTATDIKETVKDIAPFALGGLAVYGLVLAVIALFMFRAELRGLSGGG